MTDRKRLIELVGKGIQEFGKSSVRGFADEYIADYLLANGVIVQKQGKWVSAPIKDKGYDSKTIPTCTNCGYQSFITYTYCPECGAKLKEREGNVD